MTILRRQTRRIRVGGVSIGDGAPISVQTMTKTDTRDVSATVAQIKSVVSEGCDIVRLAIPDMEAAEALVSIKKQVADVPLVADIHFDHQLALKALEAGIDGLRINPGNIGGDEAVRAVATAARQRQIPIRIGVNGGSLEQDLLERYGGATAEALVESAMRHVALLEAVDFYAIKIAVKASDLPRTVAAYRLLSERTQYPLHLGLTEAGTFFAGTIRSVAAMSILLNEGIGDTLRISLTDTPEQEVRVGVELLRSLDLRARGSFVTACPTCGRTQVDIGGIATAVENRLNIFYREHPNAPRPHVAIMGCMVNGPGEAHAADIAVAGGNGKFAVYCRGEMVGVIPETEAIERVVQMVADWWKTP